MSSVRQVGNVMEIEPEPVKSSWQTMEFWAMLGVNAISLLVLFGALGSEDKDQAQTIVNNVLRDIFAMISSVTAVWKFIQSRTVVKASNSQAITTSNQVRLAAMSMPSSKMMALLLIGLFLCLGSSSAYSQQPATIKAINVTDLSDGTYVLTKKAGSTPTVVPLELITLSSIPTIPNGNDPLEKLIGQWTIEAINGGGTATTAAGISSVYSLASESVASGSIAPDKALDAVSMGLNKVFQLVSDDDKWTVFRQRIANSLNTLREDGSLSTKDEYVATFNRIAKGINVTIGFNGSMAKPAHSIEDIDPDIAGILGNIDIAKIIELIKLLKELFELFKGFSFNIMGEVLQQIPS